MQTYEIFPKDIRIVTRSKKQIPAKITLVIPDELAENLTLLTLGLREFNFSLVVEEVE